MSDASSSTENARLEAPATYECDDADFGIEPRKALKTGVWYPAEITNVSKSVIAKSHNLAMKLTFAPLDPEGKVVRKASASLDVYPNLKNKQFPDHKRPDTFFGCYCLVRALDPSFPRLPHKAGSSGMYETGEGEIVSGKESFRIRDEIEIAVQKRMAQLYNTDLTGQRCYVYVEERTNPNSGKKYTCVTKTLGDRPKDEPVIEDGNVFAEEG